MVVEVEVEMVAVVAAVVMVIVVIFCMGQTLFSCALSGHLPAGSGHPQRSARHSPRCGWLGCERRSSARGGYQAAEDM
jgi:hypothetical protein